MQTRSKSKTNDLSYQKELNPVLKKYNSHERDKNITFVEEGHKYVIQNDPHSQYTSVTTWNHSHFPHFDADIIIKKMFRGKNWKEGHKYWGLTIEEIKQLWNNNKDNACFLGTNLHFRIECFMNNPCIAFPYTHKELYDHLCNFVETEESEETKEPIESKEWNYFIQYLKDTPHLKPYRTEWSIYHEELKLSGTIDMVYENPDQTLSIYDWKRSKEITRVNNYNTFAMTPSISHLFDSNFWHYALQLNIYKAILEEKYNKIVKNLYLVRLHPEEDTYELINIPHLKKEIQDLFAERLEKLSISKNA